MTQAKRFAGNSAGYITALYLSIGLDLGEMQKLMDKSYESLLDEGLLLKVCIDPTNIIFSYHYKYWTSKDVFLSSIELFEKIAEMAKKA